MERIAILLAIALLCRSASAQCNNNIKGFVTKPDTNWARSDKTQESQTAPANAQQICNLDPNCLAWNNFGYYILARSGTAPTVAAAGISFKPYSGMCTYVKASALPSCPEKEGYITRSDTNWARSDKTQESQTAPANAQQICNLDPNCLAWNSFGYYILAQGGTAPTVAAAGVSFTPYDKLCTYVKASAAQAKPSISQPATGTGSSMAGPMANQVLSFRHKAANLCVTANDVQRLLLGMTRLALSPCRSSDQTQGFKLVQNGNAYSIVDAKGRCVTTYSAIFVRTAAMSRCTNGADQRWTLTSLSSGGKGPYGIKSLENGSCITNMRNMLSLGACDMTAAAFHVGPV
ncbi:hypothetical protein OEZ86_007272 [Tetradesmus obliquus]|nr:hypothetical protein OEZ86_007272 [Tetradesmus obliquus]